MAPTVRRDAFAKSILVKTVMPGIIVLVTIYVTVDKTGVPIGFSPVTLCCRLR
ncbi:hypothetical protein ACFPLB_15200 [Aquamicrobium segne]|uniref:Uncharacterized protein n=1 Tax=Aquamicrobium segne TaxID=469547 RepID=A0ABW0H046_9HYPH